MAPTSSTRTTAPCTKLISDVARKEFQLDDLGLDELVRWADTIDAARFDGPEHAISRSDPVLRMMSVIEHYGDDKLLAELVPELLEQAALRGRRLTQNRGSLEAAQREARRASSSECASGASGGGEWCSSI